MKDHKLSNLNLRGLHHRDVAIMPHEFSEEMSAAIKEMIADADKMRKNKKSRKTPH